MLKTLSRAVHAAGEKAYWKLVFPVQWRVHEPAAALCDAGIRGCEMHKRTGFYRPLRARFARRGGSAS